METPIPTISPNLDQGQRMPNRRRRSSHATSFVSHIVGKDRTANLQTDQGQGGGISIEDAGALGVLFANITSKQQIRERLQLFQSMRYDRASAVQIFSNFGQDEAYKIEAEARKYCKCEIPGM